MSELVTVIGGSGFLGQHIVDRLAKAGYRIRVAVRRPNDALFLKPMGDVGQIQLVQGNITHEESMAAAVAGADAVINLVGILAQSGGQTFDKLQAKGPAKLAELAAAAGVQRFIQMSAIGADAKSESAYAKTKAQGEAGVRQHMPNATVLRPSIVFGPQDEFFNRFGDMATKLPFLPLIGGGHTKYQPVYVGDVADATLAALQDPAAQGQTYELGGPTIYSFRELMEFVLAETQRNCALVSLPFGIAKLQAFFMGILPNPPLTMDQVELLKHDNVVGDGEKTLSDLGISPECIEAVVPPYLTRFLPQGQFSKRIAG